MRSYLDSSAFIKLFESGKGFSDADLLKIRGRLRSSLRRNPVIYASLWLLSEVLLDVSLEERDLRETFIADAYSGFVKTADTCIRAEHEGEVLKCFSPEVRYKDVDLLTAKESLKFDFENTERRIRDRVLERGMRGAVVAVLNEVAMCGWCETYLTHLGLPIVEDPKSLPTLWASGAFLTERWRRMYSGRHLGRIDPNDVIDYHHYMASIHADVLVTEDARFRTVVEMCSGPKPEVMSLAEWVRKNCLL